MKLMDILEIFFEPIKKHAYRLRSQRVYLYLIPQGEQHQQSGCYTGQDRVPGKPYRYY